MSDHMAQPRYDKDEGPKALYRIRSEYSWTRGGPGDEEWAEEGRPLSGGPNVYYRYYWDLEKGAIRHGLHGRSLGVKTTTTNGITRTTAVTIEKATITPFSEIFPEVPGGDE